MMHTQEIRRDSLRTTKNVLESLNFMFIGEPSPVKEAGRFQHQHISSSLDKFGLPQLPAANRNADAQAEQRYNKSSFFSQYFNRSV